MRLHNPILKIAIPSIVSNVTVPLLGLADTAIAGHLDSAAGIGAIAVGGMAFNMLYWLFGFLRMGTGGLTAQACGAGRTDEARRVLLRSLCVAMGIAVVFIAAQGVIADMVFRCVETPADVEIQARQYFSILIWGAPAMMGLYSFNGWFIGMQNARFPMYIAITQNVVNIAVSLALVIGLHRQVAGIATGTLVAQYAGFGLAGVLWRRHYRTTCRGEAWAGLWQRAAIGRFFSINRDIFLRTLCLVSVTTCFTAFGAAMGETTLAANALLMQFFVIFSYVMDGFAYAGEALGGRLVGAGERAAFFRLTRRLFCWGTALAALFSATYAIGGRTLLALLTDKAGIVGAAHDFLPLACLIPAAGVAAFIFDGLFIGATATRQMLLSMAAATAAFFLLHTLLPAGNTALWTAFLAYLGTRGATQALLYPRVASKAFAPAGRELRPPQ